MEKRKTQSTDCCSPSHTSHVVLACTSCRIKLCAECADDHAAASHGGRLLSLQRYAKELYGETARGLAEKHQLRDPSRLAERLPKLVSKVNVLRQTLSAFLAALGQSSAELTRFAGGKYLGLSSDAEKALISAEQQTSEARSPSEMLLALHSLETCHDGLSLCSSVDSELQLIESVSATVERGMKGSEMGDIRAGLDELARYCRKTISLPETTFYYFICEKIGGRGTLCRLDTEKNKVERLGSVEKYCAVTQMQDEHRVFITGGAGTHKGKSAYEFSEDTLAVNKKGDMLHSRIFHSMISAGGDHTVVVVGGLKEGKSIPFCEKYDTETDKWSMLPPLNCPRCSAGLVFLGKTLYAVGGNEHQKIESLGPQADTWKLLKVRLAPGVTLYCPCCVQWSKEEVLVLGSNSSSFDVGMWNVEDGSVERSGDFRTECFYHTGNMCTIGGKGYAAMDYPSGRVCIYDLKTGDLRFLAVE